MNIKEAKQEIENTLKAYLLKDEDGQYLIPRIRQRPVLLMGPPGIGKTAIVEQVARDNEVAFVSYTITHHTRQSAIGLPFIAKKEFIGREYSVTEYTMSEIIAAVYEKMEVSGLAEGILFIDEINCVSETLAPTMLQFLQEKTFGNHRVPEGFLIVAAGNPPEYNKSAREFDIVTLDRVKKIDIEEDFGVWKEYAYKNKIHESIISYLEIKKHNFYGVETTVDGKNFVTARGWEDLSQLIHAYEKLRIPVTAEVIGEYLQYPKIAREFGAYLLLFNKYEKEYGIEKIINGEAEETSFNRISEAPFDERLSVIGLLLGRLSESFQKAYETDLFTAELFGELKKYKETLESKEAMMDLFKEHRRDYENRYHKRKAGGLLEKETDRVMKKTMEWLYCFEEILTQMHPHEKEIIMEKLRERFNEEKSRREKEIKKVSFQLERTFEFLERAFGQSQEMVLFLSELTLNPYSMEFISQNGSSSFYKYNGVLLSNENHSKILEEIKEVFG